MFVDELDDRLAEIGKYLVIAENQRKPEWFNHTVIGMYACFKAVYRLWGLWALWDKRRLRFTGVIC